MEKFNVAAVQMNALKDDLQHNLDVHVRFIKEAAEAGCLLIVFPELSTTAHYGDPEVVKYAETAGDGPIFALMKEEAGKHGLIVAYGFCERAHGTFYNSHSTHKGGASIIDPIGKLIARSEPLLEDLMITATLDPEPAEEIRRGKGFSLRTRRPEIYGELTRMI